MTALALAPEREAPLGIPWNRDAEVGALGSMILHPPLIDELIAFLRPGDFFRASHAIVCGALFAMRDESRNIDSITLEEWLRASGELEKAGGLDAILSLMGGVPHAANGPYYARIVHELAIARELIETSQETVIEAHSRSLDAGQLLDRAESRVFAIRDSRRSSEVGGIHEATVEAMQALDDRVHAKGEVEGLGSGLGDLDSLVGGFLPQQLIVVGARPSMGKTSLGLNVAAHVAGFFGKGVLFASLEMHRRQIADRLLCSLARVDLRLYRLGRLGQDDLVRLSSAYEAIRGMAPIDVDDSPALTVSRVAASGRRMKSRKGLGLVVVDYLQLIDGENPRDSRQEQIAKISRRLKTMARELGVPVIALSQLNRASEQREDKRPRMADLRESGAIEQDADVVMLLHRPDYYDPHDMPGLAEIIVAKNRDGCTGTVRVAYRKEFTLFEDEEHPSEDF